METFERCKICCMSSKFPGSDINAEGVCSFCRKHDFQKTQSIIKKNQTDIANVIAKARENNDSPYDIIVSYSAGKDSSYTLLHLKQVYGLRILALLIDNNFVSDHAFVNARKFTEALGIDLMIFKINAHLMNKLYTKSLDGDFYNSSQLSRANSACLSCIKVINNVTLNEAILRRIPLVAGGYIEGQIPSSAGAISSRFITNFMDDNSKSLAQNISPEWEKYLKGNREAFCPNIINPLVGLEYSEEMIIEKISEYGWTMPTDTGLSSSNCLLNDYAIARHFEKHGYHPYEAEITAQVRNGTMSKSIALKRIKDVRPSKEFKSIEKKLGLREQEQ